MRQILKLDGSSEFQAPTKPQIIKTKRIAPAILSFPNENKKRCRKNGRIKKRGIWNLEETLNYIRFIKAHEKLFCSKQSRKFNKVFNLMGKQIASRNSQQCRSHHQKMIKYHQSVGNIVSYYETEVIPFYEAKLKDKQTLVSEKQTQFYEMAFRNDVLRITLKVQMMENF